jgi:hypothetical protein
MTESVVKIGDAGVVSGSGTGPAKKQVKALRRHHYDEDHDSVTISDEARRRYSLKEEDDDLVSDER